MARAGIKNMNFIVVLQLLNNVRKLIMKPDHPNNTIMIRNYATTRAGRNHTWRHFGFMNRDKNSILYNVINLWNTYGFEALLDSEHMMIKHIKRRSKTFSNQIYD